MTLSFRVTLSAASLLAVVFSSHVVCFAGTNVVLGRNVARNQLVSMDQMNHAAWDALLKRYVDENGNVGYARWQRSSADTLALDA